MTPELLRLMAGYPEQVCPHVHVSMQSGSDSVLKRMRRRDDSRGFVDRCLAIRNALDDPALTTDVMAGFPGEDEAAFDATLDFVERMGFARLHVFPFSPRPGTPAARMSGQVPLPDRRDRARRARELGARLSDASLPAERY